MAQMAQIETLCAQSSSQCPECRPRETPSSQNRFDDPNAHHRISARVAEDSVFTNAQSDEVFEDVAETATHREVRHVP